MSFRKRSLSSLADSKNNGVGKHKQAQNLLKQTATPLVKKIRVLLSRTLRILCLLIQEMPGTLSASG